MSVRWWSLLVWTLVGTSAVFWGLRLWAAPPSAPPQAAVVQPPDLLQINLARLAGGEGRSTPPVDAAQAATAAVDGRFVLVGVLSPPFSPPLSLPVSPPVSRAASGPTTAIQAAAPVPVADGVALIAVDGKLPRSYAPGSVVDGNWVLQSVSRRAARLTQPGTAAELLLSIPEPAAPARSSQSRARP